MRATSAVATLELLDELLVHHTRWEHSAEQGGQPYDGSQGGTNLIRQLTASN